MVNYLELEKLKNSIERQNVEISELKKTKDSISGQLAGIKSSDEVANIARYKLGMVYPDDEQVVYIQVDKKVAETDVKENVFLSPVISILKIFGANKGEGSLWNHAIDINTLQKRVEENQMAQNGAGKFSFYFF